MPKHCPSCLSTSLRLSRIRKIDTLPLLFLMFPIRCLECLRRSYVFLPTAMKFKPSRSSRAQKA